MRLPSRTSVIAHPHHHSEDSSWELRRQRALTLTPRHASTCTRPPPELQERTRRAHQTRIKYRREDFACRAVSIVSTNSSLPTSRATSEHYHDAHDPTRLAGLGPRPPSSPLPARSSRASRGARGPHGRGMRGAGAQPASRQTRASTRHVRSGTRPRAPCRPACRHAHAALSSFLSQGLRKAMESAMLR